MTTKPDTHDYTDATLMCGHIAHDVTHSEDVWVEIGANWAVSRSLAALAEYETGVEFGDYKR